MIWLIDGTKQVPPPPIDHNNIIYVYNKSDIVSQQQKKKNTPYLWLSTKTKEGLDDLLDAILNHQTNTDPVNPLSSRERHVQQLKKTKTV